MEFVKLKYDGEYYDYAGSDTIKMTILGRFLISDAASQMQWYRDWALNDPIESVCGNITSLDKIDGKIYLSDLYSEENIPAELMMTIDQFIQLLDDWEEKVCKVKPKEVIIKHEHDQFVIETKD